MIRPIVAYGDPVLKKEAEEIDLNDPELKKILEDMYETMYNAEGVGLAAPQVGLGYRIFIVDASPFAEDEPSLEGFKRTFINPIIVEEEGKEWKFNEGCLSIPGIREDVARQPDIVVEYYNEDLELVEENFTGIAARIVQHEYDHIEGVLFTDRLSPLKKRLLKSRLNDISKGNVAVKYKMRFPGVKR